MISLLQCLRLPKLTIFGRSLLLIALELFTNVLFWVVARIFFERENDTRPVLNLGLLAWVRIPNLCMSLQLFNEIVRPLAWGTLRTLHFTNKIQHLSCSSALDADHVRSARIHSTHKAASVTRFCSVNPMVVLGCPSLTPAVAPPQRNRECDQGVDQHGPAPRYVWSLFLTWPQHHCHRCSMRDFPETFRGDH